MKRQVLGTMLRLLAQVFVLLTVFVANASLAQQEGLSAYTLGSGDVIRIQVFGEDDLTVESQLSDAGTLSYPFLGELRVLGLTVGQLQQRIADGLRGDYLIDPRVSINIIRYRNFYINGEVKQPGGFPFQPGLTVRKAVALAGGFTERASKRNIFIISDDDPQQKPEEVSLNKPVKPGDIITVEQSFF